MKRVAIAVLLAPIRAYQRWISPAFPRRCKYEPTCSAYASEAIRELGPGRGLLVAGWRLLRCNPLSDGGIDDLCDRSLFRDVPLRSEREPAHEPPAAREPAPAHEPRARPAPAAGPEAGVSA